MKSSTSFFYIYMATIYHQNVRFFVVVEAVGVFLETESVLSPLVHIEYLPL